MPAIDIGEPLSNSSVNTNFRATGTFTPNTVVPVIVLRNSADEVIAGGALMTPGNDVWYVDYTALAQTGVKLSADMAGAQGARETNITIRSAPPIIFGNISFTFVKGAKGATTRTVINGTYDSGEVDSIVVTAFEYLPEPRNAMDTNVANSSVLASAGAQLTPGNGTWTCTLTSANATNGNRIVVRAIALTKKGRIVGHAAKRRKA